MDSFIYFFLSVEIQLYRDFKHTDAFIPEDLNFQQMNIKTKKPKKKKKKILTYQGGEKYRVNGSEESRLLACTFVCLTKPHEIGDFGIILFSWPLILHVKMATWE